LFRYQDGFVTNEKGKVMHVQGNIDSENRNIEVRPKDGKLNQQWDIVYVD